MIVDLTLVYMLSPSILIDIIPASTRLQTYVNGLISQRGIMIPTVNGGGPFRLLCVIIWATQQHSVYSVPTIADFNHNTNQVKAIRSEYFTIHQETRIVRRRRDSVDHVGFPPVMDFSLNFESGPIKLRLKRNEYMTPNVRLSDGNGPIQHDLGRKTGIYSDLEKRASFVVHCEDDMDHCTLTGSLEKDGNQWDISPEVETPQLHKAIESQSDGNINFGSYSTAVPTPGIIRDHTFEAAPRREKRAIPDCDIVECLAFVDETVWSFSLTNAGNNVTKAEEDIAKNYLALYAQADLHYDFAKLRGNGTTCIRLYLGEIVIQKTQAESWSFPNEIAIQGLSGVFVNAVLGIITCGSQGNVRRTPTNTIDLTQCFTRKDIAWNEDAGTVYYPSYRGLGFKDVACDQNWDSYSASIIESYGDKVELLLAHEIVHGLGADHDSVEGCQNEDRYIMTINASIPVDDFKLKNSWYFSTCTMRAVYAHLDQQPPCLRENSFSEADYDAFKDVPLAGRVYSWEDQCVFRFGAASLRCDPTGQNRTYFSDMCGRGIYCTRNGVCDGVNRPYEGTPCGDLNSYCLKSECYIPPRELGGICECHSDCSGSNTMCSVTSKTCVCQDGYYSNGTTTAGSCLPKVAVGTVCPSNASCLDTNAYCGGGGVCVCQEGFYTDSGACFVLKCVGEVCSSSGQCRGDNSECSGSNSTCRCPADRYLDVTTGNCVTDKILGESCEAGQCGTNNSVCDSTTNQCRCQEGFFDDNGSTAGGDCPPKVALGISCTQPDACADSNAECSSGTCSCKTDYVDISGTCERLRCAGESCSTTNQCKGTNVECSGSPTTCRCPSDRFLDVTSGNCLSNKIIGESCEAGQCGTNNSVCDSTTNQCRCQEGFFDDNGSTAGGDCLPKVALGISCTQPDACADTNAECSSGTCSCKTDYVDISSTCERLRCAGESCSTTNQCKGTSVECSGSPTTCRCPSDRYLDVTSGNCLSNKILGESCEAGQCGTNNSVCDSTTNQCRCQEGFFDDNGSTAGGDCQPKVALGISCTQPDACADSNAECSSGTCSCKTDYVDISSTCERLRCAGESCSTTNQCKGTNVECSGSPTTCRCPSDRYLDVTSGNCLSNKILGESCEAGQCGTNNSVCDSTTNQCRCQEGFFDDNGSTTGGDCPPKVALGIACTQPDACADYNAECSSGTCSCKTDYVDISGTCERLRCAGESCSTTNQCKGTNVECSGSPTTCRCPSDRYLDVTSGNCLSNKVLGESCDAGQCGTNNSVCDSTTNQCRCQEGFFDDNGSTAGGDCPPKVALGISCTQPDACADSNAECSSGTCSCKTDYVDISGTCERLRCAGESCSTTNQCKGTNVECSGSPTTCRCPSDRYLDVTSGNCLSNKVLGESCEAGQCGTNNSVCDSTTNQCRCQEGFFDDNGSTAGGDCLSKLALGISCTQPDACAASNAECSSGRCSCISGYLGINGTCERLKCFGESCESSDLCRNNTVCIGSPGTATCRCASDRYIDETTGVCEITPTTTAPPPPTTTAPPPPTTTAPPPPTTTAPPPSTTTAAPPPPTTTAPPPPTTTAAPLPTTTAAPPPPTTTAPPPPTTTAAPPPPTTTASGRCRPAPAYEQVPGMQGWCDRNCPGASCTPSHCICP